MDKKSMAIILATMGLSAGSGLTMEHAPNKAAQCAKILDTNTLYGFFFKGEALMPETGQTFIFSSDGNKLQDLIKKVTKDKKLESNRVGVLTDVIEDKNRVVCHYAYTTNPDSDINNDSKFTVTKVSVKSSPEINKALEIQEKLKEHKNYMDYLPSKIYVPSGSSTMFDLYEAFHTLGMISINWDSGQAMLVGSQSRASIIETAKKQTNICIKNANEKYGKLENKNIEEKEIAKCQKALELIMNFKTIAQNID